MLPYNYTEFIDGLTYLVNNNFVSMSRIDDAVKRILRVKFQMGLFENPLADYSLTKYLGSPVCLKLFDVSFLYMSGSFIVLSLPVVSYLSLPLTELQHKTTDSTCPYVGAPLTVKGKEQNFFVTVGV